MALFQQNQATQVDFVSPYARCLRARIIGRHSEKKGVVEQPDDLDVRLRRQHQKHHGMEIAGDKLLDEPLGLRLAQFDN